MKYVMLICSNGHWDGLSPDEMKNASDEIWAYVGKWEKLGKLTDGGAELDHPAKARTIRRDGAGGLSVVDGPYMELKEFLGGFLMIEADDLDEAIAVASEWPGIQRGDAVEVRPVVIH
jgi:hypothetical protein